MSEEIREVLNQIEFITNVQLMEGVLDEQYTLELEELLDRLNILKGE